MSVRAHRRPGQRVRLRDLLTIGMEVVNTVDHEVFTVRQVWRHEKRAQLVGRAGKPFSIWFTDLERDYQPVAEWGNPS